VNLTRSVALAGGRGEKMEDKKTNFGSKNGKYPIERIMEGL
jgi:hypothetical protein